MTGDRPDADLVATYRATGEPAHFELLVRRHRGKILRLVHSVLGDELQGDAEDVVQLAFLRAHDRLESFRGGSRFGTWLHRIAYNLAIDHRRTQQRRRRLLHESATDTGATPPDGDHARAIRDALREVPDPYQTAIRLHYWYDQSVAEIAESLGVAVGTAKSYLHRGRSRLHRVLNAKGLRS